MYFSFNIWAAAVADCDSVMTEQFTNFMTWRKVLSYKIQKIISNFCFDINAKWRVKLNNILFSISFAAAGIFVCRVILQSLSKTGAFWYISFDLVNMVSLGDKV